MATMQDLSLFFRYLFEGKIVKDKTVLADMYAFVLPKEVSNYCLGIRNMLFSGFTAYYHGGFWGTDVMYLLGQQVTISVCTLEKSKRDLNAFISNQILALITVD